MTAMTKPTVDGKLRCLQSLLHQLGARTACEAVQEARDLLTEQQDGAVQWFTPADAELLRCAVSRLPTSKLDAGSNLAFRFDAFIARPASSVPVKVPDGPTQQDVDTACRFIFGDASPLDAQAVANALTEYHKRVLAAAPGADRDAAMLDWLEMLANRRGGILLHDGSESGRLGLGLRPGRANRTLREAIASAMPSKPEGAKA